MNDPPHKVRVVCARCNYDTRRTQRAGARKTLDELRRISRCGRCGARASHGLLTIEAVAPPPPERRPSPPPAPVFFKKRVFKKRARERTAPVRDRSIAIEPVVSAPLPEALTWLPVAVRAEIQERARLRAIDAAKERRRSAVRRQVAYSPAPAIPDDADDLAPDWLEFLLKKDPRITLIQNVCYAAIGLVLFLVLCALLFVAIRAPVIAPLILFAIAFTSALIIKVMGPGSDSYDSRLSGDPRILAVAFPVIAFTIVFSLNSMATAHRQERSDTIYRYLSQPQGDARDEARRHFCETRLHWIEQGNAGASTDLALDQLIGHCPGYTATIAKVRAGESIRDPVR